MTIPLNAEDILGVNRTRSRQQIGFHDSVGEPITGLKLLVPSSGKRIFYYVFKHNGKGIRIRIEEFSPDHFSDRQRTTLLERVASYRHDISNGVIPEPNYRKSQNEARDAAKETRQKKHRPTLKTLVNRYIEAISDETGGRYRKSWRETERLIYKDVLPTLGKRIAEEITFQEFRKELSKIRLRGLVVANRVHAALTTCLKWGVEEGYLPFNPLHGTSRVGGEEKPRERDLSESNVISFWHGLSGMAPEYGIALKLLLLTGVRRSEVALAEWKEIDLRKKIWDIPGARTKSGKPHVVPLSPLVIDLIKDLQKITGTTPFWLPGKRYMGRTAFEYSNQPIRPESLTKALKKAQNNGLIEAELFTVHDLRRTLRTRIMLLGVDRDTAERLLAHQVGNRVERTYDRYGYMNEKREALTRWAEYVEKLVSNSTKVVRFIR